MTHRLGDSPVDVRDARQRANIASTPGEKLPNGTILLKEVAIRRYTYRQDTIVLCVRAAHVNPFVTWHRMITSDTPMGAGGFGVDESTFLGHYFNTLEEALKDFEERIIKHSGRLGIDDGEPV